MPFTPAQHDAIMAKLEELEPHAGAYMNAREDLFRLLSIDQHFASNAELMTAVAATKATAKAAADAISAALV